ncbi:MAG TPA: ABC transporter permease [Candidatus Acidoferrales bacterium]|nr:ABC transporter permease [Candidatus Acidoferrales bacterium]
MNVLASSRIALRALRVNKLRSTLTMLGIIIGVGAVIAMVAIGSGAQARVAEQLQALGANMIFVFPGSTTSGGLRAGAGSSISLTEEDAWTIQRDVQGVVVAAPTMRGSGQLVWGNLNWSTMIVGVTPEYFDARDWPTTSGRVFTQEDVDGAAKVAILGQTVAQSLFGDTDPIGQTVRVKKLLCTVVGVLDSKGQNTFGQDQDDVIVIPLTTAKRKVLGVSLANARTVNGISIKVADSEDLKEVQQHIRDLVRQRHRLQPGQDDDFGIRSAAEMVQTKDEQAQLMTKLLMSIASVSLLVGGIGIMNIMLVSVTERTREIGLRMAVGARGRDILTQFLVEALTVALIGGSIGVVAGLTASFALAYFGEWRTVISPAAMLLAFTFSGLIGIFFGFYPARKAAGLNPIDALRYE